MSPLRGNFFLSQASIWEPPKNMKYCEFHLKAQILPLATNTIHCFPWSDRPFHSFIRKCLPKTELWTTIAGQSSLQVKVVPGKSCSFGWQSVTQVGFLMMIIVFHFTVKCFLWSLHFVTQNIKKICLQGIIYNKKNTFFVVSSKTFLR